MALNIKKLLREYIPLAATFMDCNVGHRKEASKEVAIVLLFSLLPIWGGAIYTIVSQPDETFLLAFFDLIKHGELVLYATSILAPIFFLVINETIGERPYPDRYIQGAIILVVLIVALILFSAQRANESSSNGLFTLSVIIFCVSVALLYLATVFRNWMNDTPDLRKTERDFESDFNAWRVGK